MNHSLNTLIAAGLLISATAAAAEPSAAATLNGNADQCFDAARKAATIENPAKLSTAPCRRALRHEPISRADRSAMWHNRGIIEQAQGDLEAAKKSFARAVYLSSTVDKRNLALAQVAHKLGDYSLAVEQYDLWIEEGQAAKDAEVRDSTLANRQSAAELMVATDVASRR